MKKKIPKLLIIVIALFLVAILSKFGLVSNSLSEVLNIFHLEGYSSKYICVLNREDKSLVYAKRPKSKAYPASLTKIMTVIVAIEHIDDLSAIAPVDIDTYKEMVLQNASMAGFYGREPVTYRDLLYGTILSSGGEAANTLAIHIGGSIENFVKLMNEKALELGLKDTHFTNPEGLHDKNQYTTAYDMANLIDYALNNRHFRAVFTKESYITTPTLDHPKGVRLTSTVLSKLNRRQQKGFRIIGGKSGTTYEAGQCWATLGIKNNCEYICIVMGTKLNNIHHPNLLQREDTIKLYGKIK